MAEIVVGLLALLIGVFLLYSVLSYAVLVALHGPAGFAGFVSGVYIARQGVEAPIAIVIGIVVFFIVRALTFSAARAAIAGLRAWFPPATAIEGNPGFQSARGT